jgi:hypothetical protein
MTKAHFVKRARKDYADHDIKKGESYYWWKFMRGGRGGPKIFSKTAPKASQLTQSEFLSQIYDLQDRISELVIDSSSIEDFDSEVQSIIDDIRSLGEEQSDKYSNMPDGLQNGDVGQLLQDRADGCEQWASDLEGIDIKVEKEQGESDDDFQSRCEDLLTEITMCEYQGE